MTSVAEPAYLQSYICPVCTFSEVGDNVSIHELMGTAFLINARGVFMTAKHVLADARASAAATGRRIGVVVRGIGSDPRSHIAPIVIEESAPEPFDVCLLKTEFTGQPTGVAIGHHTVEVWLNVATCGYPINAVSGGPEALFLNLRAHRGYVQRMLKPDDLPFGPHPAGFELSFLLSRGLSGAPLFVHAKPRDIVVGICVGSMRNETIDNQRTEVLEGGETYRELQVRIDEFGIAQDLRPLHGWKPNMLNGLTLAQDSAI